MSNPTKAPAPSAVPVSKLLLLEQIIISKHNERKQFDEQALQELAADIKEKGLLQSIGVHQVNGKYEVIYGERRYRALKIAGIKQLEVKVYEVDEEGARLMRLSENLQREDLNPMDEAYGLKLMLSMDRYKGMDRVKAIQDIATRLHRTASYVAKRIQLTQLIKYYQDAVQSNYLSIGQAYPLSVLDVKTQEALNNDNYRGIWVSKKQHIPQPASIIEDRCADQLYILSHAPFDINDAELVKQAGSCTACPKRSGNNPDLFGDGKISPKDICHDPTCYGIKCKMMFTQNIAKLEKEKIPVYYVCSAEYYNVDQLKGFPQHKLLRTSAEWKQVTRESNCEHAIHAINVNSDKMGTLIAICIDKKCSKHWKKDTVVHPSGKNGQPTLDGNPKDYQEMKLKQSAKREVNAVRNELIDQLIKTQYPTTLSKKERDLSAMVIWYARNHGVNYSESKNAGAKEIKSIKNNMTKAAFLYLKSKFGNCNREYLDKEDEEVLMELCQMSGIQVKDIVKLAKTDRDKRDERIRTRVKEVKSKTIVKPKKK